MERLQQLEVMLTLLGNQSTTLTRAPSSTLSTLTESRHCGLFTAQCILHCAVPVECSRSHTMHCNVAKSKSESSTVQHCVQVTHQAREQERAR